MILERKFYQYGVVLSFILLMTSFTGYESSKLLTYTGFALLSAIAFRFYLLTGLNKITIFNLFVIILFILSPAFMAYFKFGSVTGFNFIVFTLVVFLFFNLVFRFTVLSATDYICKVVFTFAFLSSIIAIIVFFKPINLYGYQIGRENYFRLVGLFSTPNRFAEVPAVASIFAIYMFNLKKQVKYLFAALFFFALTVLGGSKGVLLALLVIAFIQIVVYRLWINKKVFRYFLFMLPFITIVLMVLFDKLMKALKLDRFFAGEVELNSGRLDIWDEGLNYYLNGSLYEQLFGYGVSSFGKVIGRDAHSTYVNLLFEYGLSIFILIIAIVIFSLVKVLKATSKFERDFFILAFLLISFTLIRGISMPTIFKDINMSMLAFWCGVAMLTVNKRRFYNV